MELVLTVVTITGSIMLLRCLFQITLFVLEIREMNPVLHRYIARRVWIGFILVLVSGMLKIGVKEMPTILTILCMVGLVGLCFFGRVMVFIDYRKAQKNNPNETE